jgi:hypothetical protein
MCSRIARIKVWLAMIRFGNEHSTIVGLTQSGKTYFTFRTLEKAGEGVLFFNTKQDTNVPSSFVTADGDNQFYQIENAIRAGKKINFVPIRDKETRDNQLRYLVDRIFERNLKLYIVVDEVQLFGKVGDNALMEIATTGLSLGIKGVWISQRPANIDNDLMTQSGKFYFFKTNMEGKYLNSYGIDADAINEKIDQGGQYAFVVYDWKTMTGPHKV